MDVGVTALGGVIDVGTTGAVASPCSETLRATVGWPEYALAKGTARAGLKAAPPTHRYDTAVLGGSVPPGTLGDGYFGTFALNAFSAATKAGGLYASSFSTAA